MEDYTSYQDKYDDEAEESSSRSNSEDYLDESGSKKEVNSDKIIVSFLSKMAKYPENKVNIIKAFEDSFFTSIALEVDSIKRLFFGDSRDGLLKMASDKEDSYLVNFHVISLIAKLLDPKKNPYADSFKKVFEGAESDTLEKIVIKMNHYAVMSEGINFEKGHLIKCLEWLKTSSRSQSKFISKNSSALRVDALESRVKLDDMLEKSEDKELFKQWKEFNANSNSRNNNEKTAKSMITFTSSSSGYIESEKEKNQRSSGKVKFDDDDKSFLRPSSPTIIENDPTEPDDMNLPDLSQLPTMKKTKSFNLNSINDNLKGRSKRFSVMKIMSDDAKEKAGTFSQSIAESIFLEDDKERDSQSNFNVPEGLI